MVAVVAGYFGFLPETNFCFSSLIQASISLRMPVSAHSSQAFPGSLSRFLNEPDFHPRPAASSARFVRIRKGIASSCPTVNVTYSKNQPLQLRTQANGILEPTGGMMSQ